MSSGEPLTLAGLPDHGMPEFQGSKWRWHPRHRWQMHLTDTALQYNRKHEGLWSAMSSGEPPSWQPIKSDYQYQIAGSKRSKPVSCPENFLRQHHAFPAVAASGWLAVSK